MSRNVYNANFRFDEGEGKVVYINGNQIVKVEIAPHRAVIHLSDGSHYTLMGEPADQFIINLEERVFETDESIRYNPEDYPQETSGLPPFVSP